MHGQLDSIQLVVVPDDANTLRQVGQDAGHLTWKRPMQARRHQPTSADGLPSSQGVLCNDLVCRWGRLAAPICATMRVESSTASNTCGAARSLARSAHRPDLTHIGMASTGITVSGRAASTSASSSLMASSCSSSKIHITRSAIPNSPTIRFAGACDAPADDASRDKSVKTYAVWGATDGRGQVIH